MTASTTCRACGETLDDYTSLDGDRRPHAGDASICWYCDTWSIYTGRGMDLRPPTPEEERDIGPRVVELIGRLATAKRRTKARLS